MFIDWSPRDPSAFKMSVHETMDSADLLVSFAAPDRGVRIFRASPTEEKKSSGADGRTFGNLGN